MADSGAEGAKIIDGKAIAKAIHLEVASGVEKLKAESNKVLIRLSCALKLRSLFLIIFIVFAILSRIELAVSFFPGEMFQLMIRPSPVFECSHSPEDGLVPLSSTDYLGPLLSFTLYQCLSRRLTAFAL